MRKTKQIVLLVLLLGSAIGVQAQQTIDSLPHLPSGNGEWTVTAAIENDSLTVGDHSTLTIRVGGKNIPSLRFPTLDALSGNAIEAIGETFDTLIEDNQKAIEQHIEIVAFAAGTHRIENIVVTTPQGLYAPSDSVTLTVVYTADADTTKCETKADIEVVGEPYTFWEIARWPVLAIALAAIACAAVWVVRRRRTNQPIVPNARQKQLPPDKKALAELESLRRKELWQKGRLKRYYTEMTDTVRRYLKAMCGMPASEMTTRQTLRTFHQSSDWSEESENLLRQLLQKADMVKFAKSQPESHEHDLAMQNAIDFVRRVAEKHAINNPNNEEEK